MSNKYYYAQGIGLLNKKKKYLKQEIYKKITNEILPKEGGEIPKEDLINIKIDESTNSSELSISLGYNALLIIHQIVEHIENQKELKKLKKNWKKGETITFEYKHIN